MTFSQFYAKTTAFITMCLVGVWVKFCDLNCIKGIFVFLIPNNKIVMRYFYLLAIFFMYFSTMEAQIVEDDFEGSGTITSWFGDACGLNTNFQNPFQQNINTSATVLEYNDTGGQYANVRFDVGSNINFSVKNTFTLKIYVPSSGITGGQINQVSLKLQDGTLAQPWTTQSEIIKPIVLDQWQEMSFNFENDIYVNLDVNSLPPIQRTDFNRVLIQVNGENNYDSVVAYVDDIIFEEFISSDPVYDNLVWSDEFDGAGAINDSKWFHQTQLPSGGSWYNSEIQHYTNRVDNSYLSGGSLNLVAKKETFSDQGYTKQYTSARLNSKFAFTYGKVEVRAKLPTGSGTWPAIWTLGQNITESGAYWQTQGYGTTSWPACGEIDIMEHWGNNQNYVQSAMHTPSSYGNTSNHGGQTITTASTGFHTYTMEWFTDRIIFSIDGITHYTYNPTVQDANTWPYDAPQYILLNFAIQSSIDPVFSEDALEVDYVRVYQENVLSVTELDVKPKLLLYPNPVKNKLNIVNLENQDLNVLIVDVNGRLIFKDNYTIKNSKLTIDTSYLKQGLYFIKLTYNDGESSTSKLIKA